MVYYKKFINKFVVIATASILTDCTCTSFNKDKSCSTDYLLVPAV